MNYVVWRRLDARESLQSFRRKAHSRPCIICEQRSQGFVFRVARAHAHPCHAYPASPTHACRVHVSIAHVHVIATMVTWPLLSYYFIVLRAEKKWLVWRSSWFCWLSVLRAPSQVQFLWFSGMAWVSRNIAMKCSSNLAWSLDLHKLFTIWAAPSLSCEGTSD